MRAFRKPLHCEKCYQRKEICICGILPVIRTRAEIVILRHVKEASRASNTGRLVALAMPNSRIISCGGGLRTGVTGPGDDLLRPGTYLLWPDGPCPGRERPDPAPPDRVVVLDATWRQARTLYNRTPVLRAIPRLVLPSPARTRPRLRDQHREDGMSTIEAVAAAVNLLEGAEKAEPLERLFDEVVRRATALRWGLRPDRQDQPVTATP